MKTHRTMVIAVVAVIAVGCSSRVARESRGDVDVSAMTGADWGGGIRGIGGWSTLRGSAYALEADTGMTVSITLERGVAGAAYSWEVLEGTCGSQGRPLADITTLPGIFLDATGRGSAVGTLPRKLTRGGQYYINVYTTSGKRDDPIACGRITN